VKQRGAGKGADMSSGEIERASTLGPDTSPQNTRGSIVLIVPYTCEHDRNDVVAEPENPGGGS
jgi:hypothetical protein